MGESDVRKDGDDRGGAVEVKATREGERAVVDGMAERHAGLKVDVVGEGARGGSVRRDAAAVDGEDARAEDAVSAGADPAGIQGQAAVESVGSGQQDRARRGLEHRDADAREVGEERTRLQLVAAGDQVAAGDRTACEDERADRLGVAAEIEGAAGDRKRAGVDETFGRAEEERAGRDRRATGMIGGQGEGQGAGASLIKGAGAIEHATERVIGSPGRQDAADRDRAAVGQGVDGLVAAQGKRRAGGDRDARAGAQAVIA